MHDITTTTFACKKSFRTKLVQRLTKKADSVLQKERTKAADESETAIRFEGVKGELVFAYGLDRIINGFLTGEFTWLMTLEEFKEFIIGEVGIQLFEVGIKQLVVKKAAVRVAWKTLQLSAKLMGKIAGKAGLRAAVKVATKIGVTAGSALAKASAAAAKTAAKGSMGPIGVALILFDLVSIALDIWDPLDFNVVYYLKDWHDMRKEYVKSIKEAIGGEDAADEVELPVAMPIQPVAEDPIAFRDEILRYASEYIYDNYGNDFKDTEQADALILCLLEGVDPEFKSGLDCEKIMEEKKKEFEKNQEKAKELIDGDDETAAAPETVVSSSSCDWEEEYRLSAYLLFFNGLFGVITSIVLYYFYFI
jgi:hypothetical protein